MLYVKSGGGLATAPKNLYNDDLTVTKPSLKRLLYLIFQETYVLGIFQEPYVLVIIAR